MLKQVIELFNLVRKLSLVYNNQSKTSCQVHIWNWRARSIFFSVKAFLQNQGFWKIYTFFWHSFENWNVNFFLFRKLLFAQIGFEIPLQMEVVNLIDCFFLHKNLKEFICLLFSLLFYIVRFLEISRRLRMSAKNSQQLQALAVDVCFRLKIGSLSHSLYRGLGCFLFDFR